MAAVAQGFELVIQLPHALSGFDIDRVLGSNGLHLVTDQHAEVLDVLVQLCQRE